MSLRKSDSIDMSDKLFNLSCSIVFLNLFLSFQFDRKSILDCSLSPSCLKIFLMQFRHLKNMSSIFFWIVSIILLNEDTPFLNLSRLDNGFQKILCNVVPITRNKISGEKGNQTDHLYLCMNAIVVSSVRSRYQLGEYVSTLTFSRPFNSTHIAHTTKKACR